MSDTCGYAVTDRDGEQQPCDRPATGWRWYQDCEHEDMLDAACDWHANEGGRIIAAIEALVERYDYPDERISNLDVQADLRAALNGADT